MKDKIAFVVQRYGQEVNGGSEAYCREVAEHMTGRYDVDVYTTCALDYDTWKNHFEPGKEELNGVTVYRYPTERPRNPKDFNPLCGEIFGKPEHSDETEEKWIDEQGPYAPKVLEALEERHGEYRAIFYMTYLYWLTARGLPAGYDHSILIPTLHDEPPVYVRYYDRVFGAAKGFAWLTPEEQAFGQKRFPTVKEKPQVLIGAGVQEPAGELPELPEQLRGVSYLVYAGRVDEGKGCPEMFRYYGEYRRRHPDAPKLVLIGKAVMEIPKDPGIIQLGFVSEEMKYAVMREARALVLFSRFESLSIVLLESMMMGRPVLVTGHSEVLKGHCIRSNAGLYFMNYYEFDRALTWLLEHEEDYEGMRENGKRYVRENYRWDGITQRICSLIEKV